MVDMPRTIPEHGPVHLKCYACRSFIITLFEHGVLNSIRAAVPFLPPRCKYCGARFEEASLNKLRVLLVRKFLAYKLDKTVTEFYVEPDPNQPEPPRLKQARARARS